MSETTENKGVATKAVKRVVTSYEKGLVHDYYLAGKSKTWIKKELNISRVTLNKILHTTPDAKRMLLEQEMTNVLERAGVKDAIEVQIAYNQANKPKIELKEEQLYQIMNKALDVAMGRTYTVEQIGKGEVDSDFNIRWMDSPNDRKILQKQQPASMGYMKEVISLFASADIQILPKKGAKAKISSQKSKIDELETLSLEFKNPYKRIKGP